MDMEEHPINKLMETTMQKIREMVDVNTIIGSPITTADGITIIPISKVSYGFAAGGTDFPSKKENKDNFGGGSGAGVTIAPIGFLAVSNGDVKMIPVENNNGTVENILGMVPDLLGKLGNMLKKDKSPKQDFSDIKLDDPEI